MNLSHFIGAILFILGVFFVGRALIQYVRKLNDRDFSWRYFAEAFIGAFLLEAAGFLFGWLPF